MVENYKPNYVEKRIDELTQYEQAKLCQDKYYKGCEHCPLYKYCFYVGIEGCEEEVERIKKCKIKIKEY